MSKKEESTTKDTKDILRCSFCGGTIKVDEKDGRCWPCRANKVK